MFKEKLRYKGVDNKLEKSMESISNYNYNFDSRDDLKELKRQLQESIRMGTEKPILPTWLPQDADEEDLKYVKAMINWFNDEKQVK